MDTNLFDQLSALTQRDINARNELLEQDNLYGQYDKKLQEIHIDNAKALDKIISNHGWPTISKVGIEGTRLAWLIAQHSICTPDLQRKFLVILSKEAEKGDIPKRQVAMLSDRILFNEGKPQIYGTVLDWNKHGELTCKLEHPEKIDELRNSVGMPPFEQDRAKHEEEVLSEGGKPYEDYEGYKKKAEKWAKNIGWR